MTHFLGVVVQYIVNNINDNDHEYFMHLISELG